MLLMGRCWGEDWRSDGPDWRSLITLFRMVLERSVRREALSDVRKGTLA